MTLTTHRVQEILAEKGYRSLSEWARKQGFSPNTVLKAFYVWERDYSQRAYSKPYAQRYKILKALDKDLRSNPNKPVLQFLADKQLAA